MSRQTHFTQGHGWTIWNTGLGFWTLLKSFTRDSGSMGSRPEAGITRTSNANLFTWESSWTESSKGRAVWCILMGVYTRVSFINNCRMGLEILSIPIKISILDNSARVKSMVRAITSLLRAQYLVESGRMIKRPRVSWLYSTEMFLMALLGTIKDTRVNTGTRTGTFMKETGNMMWKRDWASFISKTVKSTRADSSKGKNMVKVCIRGKTVTGMRGHLLRTSGKV